MNQFFEEETLGMGTNTIQRVYGEYARKAVHAVAKEMKRLEELMSFFLDSSEISRLNRASGTDRVKLSDEVLYVLKKSKVYSEMSYGAFDVTSAPLIKLWGVFTKNETVPSKDQISAALNLINYRDILIDEASCSALLSRKGQMADLGGIAKGFAADRAIEIYRQENIESAFINIGGNVRVLGSRPDGSPWSIGLQNPFRKRGEYIGIIESYDRSVVTSGDYVRFFERDGRRYHHILDPRTGYPACSGIVSATVISESSIDADALSTALLILGLEKGMELIDGIGTAEAIFVTEDKRVYLTAGARNDFIAVEDGNGFIFA